MILHAIQQRVVETDRALTSKGTHSTSFGNDVGTHVKGTQNTLLYLSHYGNIQNQDAEEKQTPLCSMQHEVPFTNVWTVVTPLLKYNSYLYHPPRFLPVVKPKHSSPPHPIQ